MKRGKRITTHKPQPMDAQVTVGGKIATPVFQPPDKPKRPRREPVALKRGRKKGLA